MQRLLPPLRALCFAAACGLSAFLLFLIQPMLVKQLLPALGGVPAVWTTAMLYFQMLLLLGYGASMVSMQRLPLRVQQGIFLAIMLGAAFSLPGMPHAVTADTAIGNPVIWVLLQLLSLSALPVLVLAMHGPLLQHWFSRISERNPYPLYAASNIGSFGGLAGYVFWLEPHYDAPEQLALWHTGFFALMAVVTLCVALSANAPQRVVSEIATRAARLRGRWVVLGFVPVSAMLAVTQYITNDVGSFPLLWVVPLALYLLSFVIAFALPTWLPPQSLIVAGMAASLLLLALLFDVIAFHPMYMAALHLALFFLIALACHVALYTSKPDVSGLGKFYFAIALGGACAGVANAVLAPLLFRDIMEYPIISLVAMVSLLAFGLPHLARKRLLLLAYSIMSVALVAYWCLRVPPSMLYQERNFYGVITVREYPKMRSVAMFNGNTLHGIQGTQAGEARSFTSYYSPQLKEIFDMQAAHAPRIGMVGLGVGTVTCFSLPNQPVDIYEINPAVVRIARNPRYFQVLSECAPDANIVLGDARKNLAHTDARYGVLVLDAYSSDSIPLHLMTYEAFTLYLSRLEPGGVILINASNRYLNLVPVLSNLAAAHGMKAFFKHAVVRPSQAADADPQGRLPHERLHTSAHWVLMTRTPEAVQSVLNKSGWVQMMPFEDVQLWTDNYSSLYDALRLRHRFAQEPAAKAP
jgi:spermidine synthase